MLRLFVALVLGAAVPGVAWCQAAGVPRHRLLPIRQAPPLPHRTGNSADVTMTLVDALPTVAVMVNGKGPFQFALDTGQPFSLSLAPGAAQRMGLTPTGEMMVGDPSGAPGHPIPTFRAHTVVLGGLTFTDVDASGAAMMRPHGPDLAGTIGMSLFAGLTLTIDYGRGRLTVGTDSLPPADDKQIVDFLVDEMGLITIPIEIGNIGESVHLDTGNGRAGLSIPADRIASLPTHGTPRDAGIAHTISQQIQIKAIDLAARVRVGSTTLPITAVSYPTIAPIGNLGSPGLVGCAVTIDTGHHRIRIIPSAA